LAEYAGKSGLMDISLAKRGDAEYARCCGLIYDRYAQTHRQISPLTAGYDVFMRRLPDRVLYLKRADDIIHLAFVEENEIAYVYSGDEEEFPLFAKAIFSELSKVDQEVFFEADDCDSTAMLLKSMFPCGEGTHYDTYIYNGIKE